MSQPQNTLAVIFASLLSTCPNIGQALALAGWSVRTIPDDDAQSAMAAMVIADATGRAPGRDCPAIVLAVIAGDDIPPFPADLTIDPLLDVASIVARVQQWRIPEIDALIRMEAMFGRDGLLPVVQGLQTELEQALRDMHQANAHRIAGLSGTLGFPAASAAWQAVDAGDGDSMAALRHSRTALVAIDGWMRGG